MASYSRKTLLSLGRIDVAGFWLNKLVNRMTYSTGLTTHAFNLNKGEGLGGTRGSIARKPRRVAREPRTVKMAEDQDWTAVYPAASSFKPNAVPLPVRMGYPVKGGVPPENKGNLELIKIPNFLHLTPAAIKKHCEALKPFCTEWPSALDTDAKCDEHFPIKLESTDYVSAGLSVRNPSARVVTLKVKLSTLNLDDHSRKKMVKLAKERYCKATDTLTLTTDSCPVRQQNMDYAMYLLTVLYHESWKMEAWEAGKTRADMEEYIWEGSPSQKNMLDVLVRRKMVGDGEEEEVREQLVGSREVQEYKESVTRLKNEGESEDGMRQYKDAVKRVFDL